MKFYSLFLVVIALSAGTNYSRKAWAEDSVTPAGPNPALSGTAPSDSAIPSSAASVSSTWYKDAVNNSAVTFFSEFYGPQISSFNRIVPDDYGRNVGNLNFDSSLIYAYKINGGKWTIGGSFNFDTTVAAHGDITVEDPYVKVGNKKLIEVGTFTFGADLRFYPPFSAFSKEQTQNAYFRSVQFMNFDIPNTKFSLTNISWIRYYNISNDATAVSVNPYACNFQVSTIPGVSYQALPKLGFALQYEMDTYQLVGNSFSNWSSPTASTGVYTSASWDITKTINFNPFVEVQTGGRVGWDTTELGAYISAKLL